jgi:predicted nucleic acid-binding protein
VANKLLISDANILIDMIVGGLLDEIFRLDYEFGLPDVLFEYELRENHADLPDKGLQVMALEATAVEDTGSLYQRHRSSGVSVNDCMALALAKQEDCLLLTGDSALRQVSILEEVDVRGTIWLVGELMEAKVISVDQAARAYDAMRADGSRLPWKEVEAQIRKFRNE